MNEKFFQWEMPQKEGDGEERKRETATAPSGWDVEVSQIGEMG